MTSLPGIFLSLQLKAPPLTHKEFKRLVKVIDRSTSKKRSIDRKVLSAAIQLAYYCGLKRQEVIDIQIRDVMYVSKRKRMKYGIGVTLQAFTKIVSGYTYPVLVEREARKILRNYLRFLLSPAKYKHNYNTNPGSPLFPQRNRKKYSPEILRNHLKYYSKHIQPQSGSSISIESIRQSGIFHYYYKESRPPGGPIYAVDRTVQFARNKKQNVEKILFY